jgi:uncharacterized membrane protein
LVVFSSRGFLVANVSTDQLTAVPVTIISQVKLQERARTVAVKSGTTPIGAGLIGAVLTSVLFDNPNLGATIGAAHGLRNSMNATKTDYSWLIDTYTKDTHRPLVTLDFGANEAAAKLFHATLLVTRADG